MDVVRDFNNHNVQNWRFTLVLPKQKVKLAVDNTYYNGSPADFYELSTASTNRANASAPFLSGIVFNFSSYSDL
jgi:hypothetical protein